MQNHSTKIIGGLPNGENHIGRIDIERNIKFPKGQMKFKKSPLPNVQVISIGYDDNFYLFNLSGVLEKHSDIKETSTPVETGITWDELTMGKLKNICYLPEGFTVFAEFEENARIYHFESMNDAPQLVYESQNIGRSTWSERNGFGIKTYYNGLGSYILAGVYGREADKRDLLLSKDGGLTFEVIKQTKNQDFSGPNSHWHDVAFDVYHGLIWASEGDSAINRDVHYSDDLGQTWYTVQPKLLRQPTAIIPFPDRVVFGRDSVRAGLDYVKKPLLEEEYEYPHQLQKLRDFKVNTVAINYYAHSPIVDGNEAYIAFSIDGELPRLLMGTGDFGRTWHFVYMGSGTGQDEKSISSFFGMDDEYVYAYGNTAGAGTSIVYAKRQEWI